MAFTPGPWLVDHIAAAESRYVVTQDGEDIARVRGGYEHTEGNAHLIAASPSMLIALRAIKKSCPTDPDVTREFNAAWALLEAAIAKAEGR